MMYDPPLTRGERERAEAYRESTRCRECKRTRHLHWPYCSQADAETKARWVERVRLRELRTARRVGDV